MTERIKLLINNLKHLPGTYLMHDKNDVVIYVGKAKDLYNRVSQYFLKPQVGKVAKMVSNVEYFETIITSNEKEALVLEMNLIQKYYPRYNILLKDGSHYPYIALSKSGYPYLTIKRHPSEKNKYDYFGPFPNSGAAFEMISLLNKIFPTRKCKNIPANSCIYYQMGQCLAPCVNKIDETKSREIKDQIKSFIKGNNQEVLAAIKEKMLLASDNLDFETANEYKKTIDAINHINMKQNVETNDHTDRDIFAYSIKEGYICLTVLVFRNGLLLGKDNFIVEEFGEINEEIVDLICQYYKKRSLPKEIVINSKDVSSQLENLLDIKITSVTKGKVYELVVNAQENANNALDQYFLTSRIDDDKVKLLEELGNILSIETPLYIELIDNSHLQGSNPVGAIVAFINGEPIKKLYRKFNIEHDQANDDILSTKEVIYRHYRRLKDDNSKMPDLLLVDGGVNQVKAAKEALLMNNLDIDVFGLYKNDKHQTAGLVDSKGNTYPIENKNLFFLLTRMQDEVHRFVISFHRNKREAKMSASFLDNIKGIGYKRKEKLLRAYPTLNAFKNATKEEFEQILPPSVAEELFNYIKNS